MLDHGRWIGALLVGALWVGRAEAQAADAPASPDAPTDAAEEPAVAQAREAFVLGTGLARQGQWIDALAAFERSAKLRAHPVTTYNIGYCERALGHYTRAHKLFKKALNDHEAGTEGKLTPEMLGEAQAYLPEVERRLARAMVTLTQADIALAVDGRPLEVVSTADDQRLVLAAGTRNPGRPEAPPAAAFDLLLDPGRHMFVLSRPGLPDTVVEESFEPGSTRPLALTARTEAPRAAPVTKSAEADALAPGPDHTWAIVAYGVGAAGIVTGATFGILTLTNKADLEDACPDLNCSEAHQGDIDAAKRNAMISTIGFGVGIAGVALGTYLLLSADDPSAQPERTARSRKAVEPWLGLGSAGVRGRF